MDFNPANQQLLRWYGKGYHFLNETMLLDMIQTQVQNKMYSRFKEGGVQFVVVIRIRFIWPSCAHILGSLNPYWSVLWWHDTHGCDVCVMCVWEGVLHPPCYMCKHVSASNWTDTMTMTDFCRTLHLLGTWLINLQTSPKTAQHTWPTFCIYRPASYSSNIKRLSLPG